jgi:hypothetical protein
MKILIKTTLGTLVLIAGIGLIIQLSHTVQINSRMFIIQLKWLTIGFLAYFPVHVIFRRLIVLYVFSHEITHALWAMLFGARVDEIYVSRGKGGYTTYTKGNMLVTLAPYFFPLYAIVFFVLYSVAEAAFKPFMLFLIGFGIAFHFLLTLYSIRMGQPDLKRVGVLFSLIFIITMNAIMIGMLITGCMGGKHEMVAFLRGGMCIFGDLKPVVADCCRNMAYGAKTVMHWIFPPMNA